MNNLVFDFGEPRKAASIKIIGVGGGGGNAANRMYSEGIQDVDFILCNSDQMDLQKSPIPTKIRLGEGLGCGSNADKGEQYAKEKTAEIQELLTDTQMVFITAGMGGGTGTGAAPVIAEICKKMDILTVAIVTLPYKFEGPVRYQSALRGVEALTQNVDSILVINNQTLREQYGSLPMTKAFEKADEILAVATRSIAEIMQKTGFINVDFEDVRAVMKDSNVAVMAAGSARGENRAYEAIEMTLESPLLNKADVRGAKKILLNITSSKENELTGDELEIIMEYVRQKAQTDVNITWGYMVAEPETEDEIKITMIATGFDIEDIPDFRKPQEKKVIQYSAGGATEAQSQFTQTPGTQTELFPQNEGQQINTSSQSFDYKSFRESDDVTDVETIPAWKRRQQSSQNQISTEGMSRSQATEIAVANRIKGSEPSQISLDKDSKGIVLGDNKYLNHNVD